ncbi:hypothetical protein VT03_10935 [Planctomyces sp. SH-PL14]|nr:hypothetical protein VT03_10935 [Planctomyces sp. SH-PL14]
MSDLIRASVSYTNRAYRVYGVPFANHADGRIFVIEYDDSPHAPHQSNSDQKYYYRVGHSSAPAPHFYVDLLSKRMTHAIVEVDRIRYSSGHCVQEADAVRIHYTVAIEGQNRSVQAATHGGIHFSSIDSHWRVVTGEGETLVGSGSVSGRRTPLLPKQSFSDRFELYGRIPLDANGNVAAAANALFEALKIRCEGISQNHAGNEYVLAPHNDPVNNEAYYEPVRGRR